MAIDLLQNMGGPAADLLINSNFDTGVLRPFVGQDGRTYITRIINGKPRVMVTNSPSTLTYDAYKVFDNVIVTVLRNRLKAFADIRAAGLTYNLPNGMAHSILQYQTTSDISAATVSMDPVRRSESDRPTSDIGILPLPIIHKDFDFTAREILASRQGLMPLDTTSVEMATIKVAEEVEKMTLGTVDPFTYGGGSIYGYTNFPNRIIKTDMTVPDGTNGATVLADLLTLRQSLINDKHFGPYRLYLNSQWSEFLDTDFKTLGDQTLRQRILAVNDIQEVQVLDFLPTTNYHAVMVEMQSPNVRAVIGMEAQTVQWESAGGLQKHFKVMCMLIPQLRPDTAGNSGIAHGRTP